MLKNKHPLTLFIFSILFLFSSLSHAQSADELFRHAGDPVGGNPRGTITIVEFFDYQCTYCANMVTVINNIINANPAVRVVYKDLPVLGPDSTLAARAALAAKRQGAYVEFNRALWRGDDISSATVFDIARKLGLNIAKFKADMDSSSVSSEIDSNLQLANALGVHGTPAFFIGKTNAGSLSEIQPLAGEMSQSEMQEAVSQLR